MNSGYKVFLDLQHRNVGNEGFVSVDSVPFSQHHKIGISPDGYPLFFVKCDNQSKSIDITLELISVLFSQECSIKEVENEFTDLYTIVVLKTVNRDLQQYFTDVFSIILQQLDPIPTEVNLNREIRKVIDLFSYINKPAVKSIQGLWAEMLMIEKSINPEYLINAWHISPQDKYDFNDSIDKLEVKSTSKSKRVHKFSFEQLTTNPSSSLLIASTFVIETGSGKSILNLRDSIVSKITDLKMHLRLNEMIYKTMGNEYEKLGDVFFDYNLAFDSLSFYDVNNIPRISSHCIPKEISNLVFDCDLTNVTSVAETGWKTSKSKLFQSLGI